MMRYVAFVAALLAAPSVVLANDDGKTTPLVFEPSSAWVADYATDSCALRRSFSHGNDRIDLQFSSKDPLSRSFETTVASNSIPLNVRKKSARYQFTPLGKPIEISTVNRLEYGDGWLGLQFWTWMDVGQDASDLAKVATGFQLDGMLEPDVLFATGSLNAPMQAMTKCLDELLGAWGLDPAQQRSLSRRAEFQDQSAIFDALRKSRMNSEANIGRGQGLTFRLTIDAKGQAISCDVLAPEIEKSKSDTFCEAMLKSSKLSPAIDQDGRPVESYTIMQIGVFRTTRSFDLPG